MIVRLGLYTYIIIKVIDIKFILIKTIYGHPVALIIYSLVTKKFKEEG